MYVTYVGNASKQKRFNLFLDVAKKLKNRFKSKIFFLILGKNLKKFIFKNDSSYIFFDFNYNVLELLKTSNLVVAPSINEGFGRVIVESSLLEVPILASNSGAHTELIKNNETGFLAKTDSAEDFLKRLH